MIVAPLLVFLAALALNGYAYTESGGTLNNIQDVKTAVHGSIESAQPVYKLND